MNIIAHRCNNYDYFEHSLDSCQRCLDDKNIDGLEIDVRLCKDNVLVVSHDNFVKTYKGKIINIKKIKYNNLKKYNIGNSINVVRIRRLDDYLSKFKTNKKIIIEIKDDDKRVVDILYSVINKYELNYYICSFNYDIVTLFKKRYPKYKVGLFIGYMLNYDKFYNELDFNLLHYNLLNRINLNKEVFIWTVNNKKIYDKICKISENINIISDKPYLFY